MPSRLGARLAWLNTFIIQEPVTQRYGLGYNERLVWKKKIKKGLQFVYIVGAIKILVCLWSFVLAKTAPGGTTSSNFNDNKSWLDLNSMKIP